MAQSIELCSLLSVNYPCTQAVHPNTSIIPGCGD